MLTQSKSAMQAVDLKYKEELERMEAKYEIATEQNV